MRRRDFTAGLLGGTVGLVVRPRIVRAQRAMPTIGFLRITSAADSAHLLAALTQGLKEAGFVAGQNFALEARYADNHRDRAAALAADLVKREVAVIITDQAVHDVKAATSKIPIVFVLGADPVAAGLVSSLNRPGANISGVVFFSSQLGAKRIGLLRQMIPAGTTIGMLAFSLSPEDKTERNQVEAAAREVGQTMFFVDVAQADGIEPAFAKFAEKGVGAVLVGSGPLFRSHKDQIVALAARYRLPTSYSLREYVQAGGLMSYGTSIDNAYREAGHYAARILKGESPTELPVLQSTNFEFVINMKTARSLGLIVPQSLLLTADEEID